MADALFNRDAGLESPAWDAVAITEANADLARIPTRGLYVGGAGDLVVYMAGRTANTEVTFAGVVAGTILPIRVDQLRTASTATNIVALY